MKNISCDKITDFVNSGDDQTIIKSFVEKVFEKVKDKEDSKDREVDMMEKIILDFMVLF